METNSLNTIVTFEPPIDLTAMNAALRPRATAAEKAESLLRYITPTYTPDKYQDKIETARYNVFLPHPLENSDLFVVATIREDHRNHTVSVREFKLFYDNNHLKTREIFSKTPTPISKVEIRTNLIRTYNLPNDYGKHGVASIWSSLIIGRNPKTPEESLPLEQSEQPISYTPRDFKLSLAITNPTIERVHAAARALDEFVVYLEEHKDPYLYAVVLLDEARDLDQRIKGLGNKIPSNVKVELRRTRESYETKVQKIISRLNPPRDLELYIAH